MILRSGKRTVIVWTCDQCSNEMLSESRPKRCTRASCRKVADYVKGVTTAGRPRKR